MAVVPPGVFVSWEASAPVFGLRRKFSPSPVTTRMRSTVGLKSNPYPTAGTGSVPVVSVNVPTAVAVAVVKVVWGSIR